MTSLFGLGAGASGGRAMSLELRRNQDRGRRLLQQLVRRQITLSLSETSWGLFSGSKKTASFSFPFFLNSKEGPTFSQVYQRPHPGFFEGFLDGLLLNLSPPTQYDQVLGTPSLIDIPM